MKTCSNCGAQCDDNSVFCTSCGTKFTQPEQNTQQTEEPVVSNQSETSNQAQVQAQTTAQATAQDLVETNSVQSQTQAEPTIVKCEFCGELVQNNEAVCPKCGAQIKYSKQASIEAATGEFISANIKKIKKVSTEGIEKIKTAVDSVDKDKTKQMVSKYKKYIPIGGAALVLLVILLVLVPKLASSPNFATYGANTFSFYNSEFGMTFYNNSKVIAEVEDTYDLPLFNLNHTKAVVLTDYSSSEGGTLYYVDASGEKVIGDGVIAYEMSVSGNGVAFFADFDRSEGTATLMLYNGNNAIEIKDDINIGYYEKARINISPDGKTVAYTEYDGDDFETYISTNGKTPKKLGNNQKCVAISDGGKYIYYIDYDKDSYSGDLYVKSGNKKVKLASDADNIYDVIYTKDLSQMMFTYDGKTYVSLKGKDKVKLISERASLLLPVNTMQTEQSNYISVYGVDSFTDKLILGGGSVYYINGKYETNKVASKITKAAITKEMDQLVYMDYSENLHIVTKLTNNNPKDVELEAAEDVINFSLTEDGKIYYVNDDEELYSISTSNKTKKIADDVYEYTFTSVGNKLFFLVDYSDSGVLYYTTGSKKTAVKNADDVRYVHRLGNGVVYQQGPSSDREVYGTTGSSFKKIFEINY